MSRRRLGLAVLAAMTAAVLGDVPPAAAQPTSFRPASDPPAAGAPGWASLASDRMASDIGDGLTVLIAESATASGTTLNSLSKKTSATGAISSGASHLVGRGALNLDSGYDGAGQSVRSDKMVASISVTVVGVAPNGDLIVAGEQALNVNGERTHIRVHGRARRVDISSANTILSTRLAEAQIDYNGAGVIGRGARPGLLSRLLTGFGAF